MYAVVDIETTGGNYKTGKIIELAVALFDGKSVVDSFETLINPGCHIPPFITGLTGISNAMVRQAPFFQHIAAKFVKMTAGSIFVAHNVTFDYSFIKQAYKDLGYPFKMPRICTLQESKKSFLGLRSYGLENLCRDLQIHNHNPHRAMGDVMATVELLKKIMKTRQNGSSELFFVKNDL
jgi:DNA polymerase III subunit epsilon